MSRLILGTVWLDYGCHCAGDWSEKQL